jgi:hypothetical protein
MLGARALASVEAAEAKELQLLVLVVVVVLVTMHASFIRSNCNDPCLKR